MTAAHRVALIAVALAPLGCTSTTPPANRPDTGAGAISIGVRLAPQPVEVTGGGGTAELRVQDPGQPGGPRLIVTLVRAVPREPRDVCFGTYTTNESPEDGDLGCQVRGREPMVLSLTYQWIPRSSPVHRFIAIYGQAKPGIRQVELIGPSSRRTSLPLSAHRMFLAAFAPTARGALQLRLQFANGESFSHSLSLPLTAREAGPWPRLRRRGAVFDYEVGENIVTKTYRQIIRRFGPPLRSFTKPNHTRCVYYDTVGYQTGWSFCFKGQRIIGAAGNQPVPAGVH